MSINTVKRNNNFHKNGFEVSRQRRIHRHTTIPKMHWGLQRWLLRIITPSLFRNLQKWPPWTTMTHVTFTLTTILITHTRTLSWKLHKLFILTQTHNSLSSIHSIYSCLVWVLFCSFDLVSGQISDLFDLILAWTLPVLCPWSCLMF